MGCAAILVVTSRRIFNNFRAELDRTEPDRFGPTRCGPVDDVIIGSETGKKLLLTHLSAFRFLPRDATFSNL